MTLSNIFIIAAMCLFVVLCVMDHVFKILDRTRKRVDALEKETERRLNALEHSTCGCKGCKDVPPERRAAYDVGALSRAARARG